MSQYNTPLTGAQTTVVHGVSHGSGENLGAGAGVLGAENTLPGPSFFSPLVLLSVYFSSALFSLFLLTICPCPDPNIHSFLFFFVGVFQSSVIGESFILLRVALDLELILAGRQECTLDGTPVHFRVPCAQSDALIHIRGSFSAVDTPTGMLLDGRRSPN